MIIMDNVNLKGYNLKKKLKHAHGNNNYNNLKKNFNYNNLTTNIIFLIIYVKKWINQLHCIIFEKYYLRSIFLIA